MNKESKEVKEDKPKDKNKKDAPKEEDLVFIILYRALKIEN